MPRFPRKRLLQFAIVIALLLVVGAVWNYFFSREEVEELVVYGNVDVRLVDIGFRVGGRVEKLCFEEGDYVAKGALMATLDRSPYDARLAEARASAEATRVNFQNTKLLLERRQGLIGIGGVSQEDLENTQSSLNQLKANLAQAEAGVAVAEDNLAYTEAYAPTEGVILTRIREPGSTVRETDPVYTLSISSPVWVRAFIAEPNLGQICYGMAAEITTDTPGAPVYTGKVGFISPLAEFTPKTVETTQLRTDLVYRLRIYVDNPDKCLKQGMPVTVKFKLNG